MDSKRIIILVTVSIAIVAGWMGLNALIQRRHPEWYQQPAESAPQTSPTSAPSTAPATGGPAASTSRNAPTVATSSPAPMATSRPAVPETAALHARPATRNAQPASIGHSRFDKEAKSEWPLGLTIDPYGAGVASVTLNRYRDRVGADEPYIFQKPYGDKTGEGYERVALAARSLSIDDGPWIDIGAVPWQLDGPPTEDSASYSLDIVEGDAKVLTITKKYALRKKTDRGEGFELDLTYSFVGHVGRSQDIRLSFNGPNVPPVENSRDTPEVVVGFNEEGKFVGFDHTAGGYFKEGVEPKSLADPKRPLMWAGITSAYFDSIVLLPNADQLADVRARAIAKADGITGQEYLALTFVTGKLTVPAQATGAATTASLLTMPLEVYLGPRHRELLGNSYYARFPRGYDDTIVIKSKGFPGSICAACTWGWLIDGLVWVLNRFHFVLRDWGLAIILLVVIVRLMLHPITKRSQVSMQKMTKMGPEIERLKKKFGDDKEGLNRAMMDFYREHGYGRDQILGCLPMFLQMPIWIALWTALQGTFELRHSSFLWGFTWVKDLAQPDRLIPFHHTYTLIFGWTVDAVNLLPILLGVVFYLQQKMAPKPASETPEQAQQRKMMSWMSLLFPLILYNGPAGLNLYIFASTAIGIWESKRVRDHIKAQEAAETAGKVIVDAGSKRASKRLAGPEQVQQPGCLTGWLGNLQKKAEQMRDESQKKRPKR